MFEKLTDLLTIVTEIDEIILEGHILSSKDVKMIVHALAVKVTVTDYV